MKAATRDGVCGGSEYVISIHAAREGGDGKTVSAACEQEISIHAAREGGDQQRQRKDYQNNQFQSTPPVKAATVQQPDCKPSGHISIHAAREGGDVIPPLYTQL